MEDKIKDLGLGSTEDMTKLAQEQITKAKKEAKFGPITKTLSKEEMKELEPGFHPNKYTNRRGIRNQIFQGDKESGNNRKRTKCRLKEDAKTQTISFIPKDSNSDELVTKKIKHPGIGKEARAKIAEELEKTKETDKKSNLNSK